MAALLSQIPPVGTATQILPLSPLAQFQDSFSDRIDRPWEHPSPTRSNQNFLAPLLARVAPVTAPAMAASAPSAYFNSIPALGLL